MAKDMPRKNMLKKELEENIEGVAADIEQISQKAAAKTTRSSRKNKDGVSFGSKGAPSKAQLALIERYKCEKHTDVVNNTLDEIISEEILKIQTAINNMVEYGDSKVFRVLPKELDKYIRDYGVVAQEYFGRRLKNLENTPVYIVPVGYKQCGCCKQYKQELYFYSSHSDMYPDGKVPICRDCASKLFNKYLAEYHDVRECLVLMCQKLDVCVYEPLLEKYVELFEEERGKDGILDGTFLGNFIKDTGIELYRLNLNDDIMPFCKTNLGGVPFKEFPKPYGIPKVYNDVFADKKEDVILNVGKRSLNRLKEIWGDYPKDDLIWLENRYEEWKNDYDIRGKNRETLVRQLCYEEWSIYRGRENGADVLKNVKALQELLKNSDLTPKMTSKSSENTMFNSIGSMISTFEKSRPIKTVDPEFDDVDNITKIWESLTGALARTTGKNSPYIEKFDKNMEEYTVSLQESEE